MTRSRLLGSARGMLVATSLLIAGCVAPPHHPSNTISTPTPLRLAQVGYGRDATFETCSTDICPQRTVKTVRTSASPQVEAISIPTPEVGSMAMDRDANYRVIARAMRLSEESLAQQIDIRFGFGSARLSNDARKTLRELAPQLANAVKVSISGRTDSFGPSPVNQQLAKARATVVLRELLIFVPDIARLVTVDARGGCCYAQSNDSAAGRALNRRVEIRYWLDNDASP